VVVVVVGTGTHAEIMLRSSEVPGNHFCSVPA